MEAHPKHRCEQSQRKTLTQALKQTERGARPGLQRCPTLCIPLCFKRGNEAEITNIFAPEPRLLYPYEQFVSTITDSDIVFSGHDTCVLYPELSNGENNVLERYMLIFSSCFITGTAGAVVALTPPCIVNINCVRCSCSTEAHSHGRQVFIGLGAEPKTRPLSPGSSA